MIFPHLIPGSGTTPLTYDYGGHDIETGASPTFSFSCSWGDAGTDRMVVVCLLTYDAADHAVSSITIGGNAMTVLQSSSYNAGGYYLRVTFAARLMDTGTSGIIAVSMAGVTDGGMVFVHSVYGKTSTTESAFTTDTASAGSSLDLSVAVPAGGIVIGSALGFDTPSPPTMTFTNLTNQGSAQQDGGEDTTGITGADVKAVLTTPAIAVSNSPDNPYMIGMAMSWARE